MNATVNKHKAIIPNLLAAHGLTGCNTVATCYGIGKDTALKVLKSNNFSLSHLGDTKKSPTDIVSQATQYMLTCYGLSKCNSMTEARQKIWAPKVAQSTACAPKLSSLPPTNEAFRENVARAHLQVAIWQHSLQSNPHDLNPERYGWSKEKDSKSYVPTTVPDNVP